MRPTYQPPSTDFSWGEPSPRPREGTTQATLRNFLVAVLLLGNIGFTTFVFFHLNNTIDDVEDNEKSLSKVNQKIETLSKDTLHSIEGWENTTSGESGFVAVHSNGSEVYRSDAIVTPPPVSITHNTTEAAIENSKLVLKRDGSAVYRFPEEDGAAEEVLATDGLGRLYWMALSSAANTAHIERDDTRLEVAGDSVRLVHNGTVVYTLPSMDGAANQVLKTDGNGTLSWNNLTATVDTSSSSDITVYTIEGGNTSTQDFSSETESFEVVAESPVDVETVLTPAGQVVVDDTVSSFKMLLDEVTGEFALAGNNTQLPSGECTAELNSTEFDEFGYRVRLSYDGMTMVVCTGGSMNLYGWDDVLGGWEEEASFSHADLSMDDTGSKIGGCAISGNGMVAAGSEPWELYNGVIGVVEKDPVHNTWFVATPSGLPPPQTSNGDAYGVDISFDEDGTTFVTGAYFYNFDGIAYVFARNASTGDWAFEQELVPAQYTSSARFGRSVDMARDGKDLVVGHYYVDDGNDGNQEGGFAQFYKNSTGTWVQDGSHNTRSNLSDPIPGESEFIGRVISRSADGNLLASMAEPYLFIFRREGGKGGVWGQEGPAILLPFEFIEDDIDVAVSGNGRVIMVNTQEDTTDGHTFIVVQRNGVWELLDYPVNPEGAVHWQGSSGAISYDGRRIVVSNHIENSQAGAVWTWC